jgi:hypothetical protein
MSDPLRRLKKSYNSGTGDILESFMELFVTLKPHVSEACASLMSEGRFDEVIQQHGVDMFDGHEILIEERLGERVYDFLFDELGDLERFHDRLEFAGLCEEDGKRFDEFVVEQARHLIADWTNEGVDEIIDKDSLYKSGELSYDAFRDDFLHWFEEIFSNHGELGPFIQWMKGVS